MWPKVKLRPPSCSLLGEGRSLIRKVERGGHGVECQASRPQHVMANRSGGGIQDQRHQKHDDDKGGPLLHAKDGVVQAPVWSAKRFCRSHDGHRHGKDHGLQCVGVGACQISWAERRMIACGLCDWHLQAAAQ